MIEVSQKVMLQAELVERPYPGGGTVEVVVFCIDGTEVQVWPVRPDDLDSFAAQVRDLAARVRKKETGST